MTLWSIHVTSHLTVCTCALQKSNLILGAVMAPKRTDNAKKRTEKEILIFC